MLNQSRPVARTEVAFGRCCASQPGDGEASELFQVGAITLSTYAHAFAAPTTSPAEQPGKAVESSGGEQRRTARSASDGGGRWFDPSRAT